MLEKINEKKTHKLYLVVFITKLPHKARKLLSFMSFSGIM